MVQHGLVEMFHLAPQAKFLHTTGLIIDNNNNISNSFLTFLIVVSASITIRKPLCGPQIPQSLNLTLQVDRINKILVLLTGIWLLQILEYTWLKYRHLP
jgi:hypothetical protein